MKRGKGEESFAQEFFWNPIKKLKSLMNKVSVWKVEPTVSPQKQDSKPRRSPRRKPSPKSENAAVSPTKRESSPSLLRRVQEKTLEAPKKTPNTKAQVYREIIEIDDEEPKILDIVSSIETPANVFKTPSNFERWTDRKTLAEFAKSAIRLQDQQKFVSPKLHTVRKSDDILNISERIKMLLNDKNVTYDKLKEREAEIDLKMKSRDLIKEKYRPLTEDERTIVRDSLRSNSETVADKFDLIVSHFDIKSLRPMTWLNDLVIDFYYQLIAERSQSKIYAYSTYFYKQLNLKGFDSIKKWTRGVDIFAFDQLFLPIHMPSHWCFAAVNFKTKSITYFDSLSGSNNRCIELLFNYLESESLDKRKIEFDRSGWTSVQKKGIPRQQNGYDCGVFSCIYAEFLGRGEEFTFSQADMPYFRERIICEIVTGKLFNS